MPFVGLDVGGTFLKAAILTRGGDVGPVTRLPVPNFLDTSGAAREIDPGTLVSAVRELVARIADDADIDGIHLTGQMAGIAFVDESGQAVAPLISWQDTRAQDVDAVARALGPDCVADLGDGLRVGLPLVTLNELGVPMSAYLTSLIGFIAGSLCNSRVPFVHATDAAAWGMYDVRHRHWSEPALALLGLQAGSLPSVSCDIVAVGTSSQFGVPVLCAVGDQQAALLGAGLVADIVSVNLATGCQVSVLSSSIDSPAQLRPFLFESVYLHTITHLPAGRLLTAAVRECRGSAEYVDWVWAAENVCTDLRIELSVETIAQGVAGAVARLGACGVPVLFSGGLVQQFAPVRERIIELLNVPAIVYPGDDAALAGLATLVARTARDRTANPGHHRRRPEGIPRWTAVLFDLDGTLVDTRPGIKAALAAAFAEVTGSDTGLEQADLSLPLDEMIRTAAPTASGDLRRRLSAAFRRHYDSTYWEVADVYPGAEECLRDLGAAGVRAFVVTNKRTNAARQLLERVGLAPYLEDIVGQAEEDEPLSKAELAGHCLDGASLDPGTTVVVGDSHHDAAMAAAWCMPFILVSYGAGRLSRAAAHARRWNVDSLVGAAEIVLLGPAGGNHES